MPKTDSAPKMTSRGRIITNRSSVCADKILLRLGTGISRGSVARRPVLRRGVYRRFIRGRLIGHRIFSGRIVRSGRILRGIASRRIVTGRILARRIILGRIARCRSVSRGILAIGIIRRGIIDGRLVLVRQRSSRRQSLAKPAVDLVADAIILAENESSVDVGGFSRENLFSHILSSRIIIRQYKNRPTGRGEAYRGESIRELLTRSDRKAVIGKLILCHRRRRIIPGLPKNDLRSGFIAIGAIEADPVLSKVLNRAISNTVVPLVIPKNDDALVPAFPDRIFGLVAELAAF